MSKLSFGNRGKAKPIAQTQGLVNLLEQLSSSGLANKVTDTQARSVIATESLSDHEVKELDHACSEVRDIIYDTAQVLGLESLSDAQFDAAAYAAMISKDPQAAVSQEVNYITQSDSRQSVYSLEGLSNVLYERPALEAYDPKENRNAQLFSIAYNLLSAGQDPAVELIYPTLVVSPNEAGIEIRLDRHMVFDGYERKLNGTVENWNRKNLVRALADHTILHKEQNRVIPIVRDEYKTVFVDPNLIPSRRITLEGESEAVETAPLVFGKKIDLLAVSQRPSQLRAGVMDHTDQLEPAGSISRVFFEFGSDILAFDLSNLPMSNWVYAPQGDESWMNFNFKTASILINKNRLNIDGSPLTTLAPVVDNDLNVRVELSINGTLNLDTAEIQLFANGLDVRSVRNQQGEYLDLNSAPAAAIVEAIRAGKGLGYEPLNYLVNSNIRLQGQLLDNVPTRQIFNVPLRSPIAKVRPINQSMEQDAGHLQALVSATRFSIHNEFVTRLFSYTDTLREYVYETDTANEAPDILGIGRHYVIPRLIERTFDVKEVINSIKTMDRIDDVQSGLTNLIRDIVFNLHRDSEYASAQEALYGGKRSTPVVAIVTDPVTSRYLQIKGDLRLINDQFEVKIAESLDHRMKGKIFITFADMSGNRNAAVNPIDSGNLLYKPETVIATQVSRNGQTSHELIVTPCYLFVNHLPVFGLVHVENLSEAMVEKLSLSVSIPDPVGFLEASGAGAGDGTDTDGGVVTP